MRLTRWSSRWSRGQFQFRLREFLLLVALIAVVAAWWNDHRKLSAALAWQKEIGRAWSVEQATGPPNTPDPGDKPTAWASATPDGQQEWLQLRYSKPVNPVAVLVHETFNPGAVFRVAAVGEMGQETVLWEGIDPTSPNVQRGVSRLPVAPRMPVSCIKVYIDSAKVSGWNEIDAVGLECKDGTVAWAVRATASSSYATRGSAAAGGWGRYTIDVF